MALILPVPTLSVVFGSESQHTTILHVIHVAHKILVVIACLLLAVVRGKDETPDIEDLGSVFCDISIQTVCLPTISLFSPMVTQVRQ
jgi:hypothetical protein